MVHSLTGLDSTKPESMLIFVCCKATKSKPIKLEIDRTLKLALLVIILCLSNSFIVTTTN